jgi:hypothetical protein
LRVGFANVLDDLVKRHGFTAHAQNMPWLDLIRLFGAAQYCLSAIPQCEPSRRCTKDGPRTPKGLNTTNARRFGGAFPR